MSIAEARDRGLKIITGSGASEDTVIKRLDGALPPHAFSGSVASKLHSEEECIQNIRPRLRHPNTRDVGRQKLRRDIETKGHSLRVFSSTFAAAMPEVCAIPCRECLSMILIPWKHVTGIEASSLVFIRSEQAKTPTTAIGGCFCFVVTFCPRLFASPISKGLARNISKSATNKKKVEKDEV